MVTVKYTSATRGVASAGAAAYALSRLGMRVFPLTPGPGGSPALAAWPERATREVDVIRQWWTGDFAGCGVGVATGPESGVWVLDIDVKDVDGFASLRDLEHAKGGVGTGLYRTMCVRTPSGGAHLYYRWDPAADLEGGVRNSASDLAPGVDVRGIGGHVRAPGTVGYSVLERARIVDTHRVAAPGWLTALTKRADVAAYAEARARTEARAAAASGNARAWGAALLERSGKRLRRALPGQRNNELNRVAFVLGCASVSGGFDEAAAWAMCRAVMVEIGAGDSERAQRRTFLSGWRSGRAGPRQR